MYVVIIHSWREMTIELAQALAAALEATVFDAQQRLIGNGPTVVASFAEPQPAQELLMKLQQTGFEGFVVDDETTHSKNTFFVVRRFELEEKALRIEDADGCKDEIAYSEIDLLLPATRIAGHTETHTVTDRKFSMGKTLLAGGVPMTKKVKRQEEVSIEERERILYLCARNRPRVICAQSGMVYDSFGAEMKPSQEMNFNFLVSELRRRCPVAVYDDRLLKRAGQVRLLGPTLNPDTNLGLAVEILARGAVKGNG